MSFVMSLLDQIEQHQADSFVLLANCKASTSVEEIDKFVNQRCPAFTKIFDGFSSGLTYHAGDKLPKQIVIVMTSLKLSKDKKHVLHMDKSGDGIRVENISSLDVDEIVK